MYKKILFILILLLSLTVKVFAGDTAVLTNARTLQDFEVNKNNNASFETLINNSTVGDTFIFQDSVDCDIVAYYCIVNGSNYESDNDLPNYRKGLKISYNKLQYRYYLQFDSNWIFLYRFNEISIIGE